MSHPEFYIEIKKYLETKPASHKLFSYLSDDVEIGIVIEERLSCSYFKQNGAPAFENRPAKKPDIVFLFSADGVETILKHSGEDLGEFILEVLKLTLASQIKVKVPGHLPRLLMAGYVQALRGCYKTLYPFLAAHGVSSLTKIPQVIAKLKSLKP